MTDESLYPDASHQVTSSMRDDAGMGLYLINTDLLRSLAPDVIITQVRGMGNGYLCLSSSHLPLLLVTSASDRQQIVFSIYSV